MKNFDNNNNINNNNNNKLSKSTRRFIFVSRLLFLIIIAILFVYSINIGFVGPFPTLSDVILGVWVYNAILFLIDHYKYFPEWWGRDEY